MNLVCIADEDTVRGFRLAGIEGEAVRTGAEAAAALDRAAAEAGDALVILTEAVADGIRADVDRLRIERSRLVLVEIPGPDGPLPGRKRLRRLVQEAVGLGVSQ